MKNFNIVELRDGLGNQMFEYAFALGLAKKQKRKILFDKTFFDDPKSLWYADFHNKRQCMLGHFHTRLEFVSPELMRQYRRTNIWALLPYWVRIKFKKNSFNYKKSDMQTYERSAAPQIFSENLLNVPDKIIVGGWFQSYKYFPGLRNQLIKDFRLKTPMDQKNKEVLKLIKKTNSVSVHVRRGDYITSGFSIMPIKYYSDAIKYLEKKFKNLEFFVFSDDIEWAKENFKKFKNMHFIDINSQDEVHFDLELMKHCKHNIIANSTLSWWGAYLNNNRGKIVIAPKVWFKFYKSKIRKQLAIVLPEWTVM